MKQLILGGVRSGKSRLAEQHARHSGFEVLYVATARAEEDAELQERIRRHREQRPPTWPVVEEPLHLAATLGLHARAQRCIVVDCLTLWLTNLLRADDAQLCARECAALLELLPQLDGDLILIGNETGLGIVPMGALSRRFIDANGVLHQQLAALCDRVLFTVAGLAHVLKGP
jgi:adenosylcobinamide kinase/adenosylcobinamide-phosphate guanylyltransferase